MDRSRSRTRMPVYRKPMATPRFADRRYSHQLSPAVARVRAVQSGALPDEEVKQVSFPAFVDDRVSGLVRPPDHLDRRRRIVRHEVDDLPDLNPREQLVQLREDRRTLDADLEHLVIGERGEASNPQGRNLFREEQTRVRGRPQAPTFFLEIRRLQASKPSAFVGGVGQRPRLREDVGVDLPKDPADGRADRTEILPALQEPDGGASGVRDSERFGCDLHDRPRECREDAGNPDDKVPGHEGASPDESLRVVEEVVRELTVFDFHEEGSSTRRTSARRSSASASDRTLSSGASKSVAAPRGNTVAPFTLTGPPLRTYR